MTDTNCTDLANCSLLNGGYGNQQSSLPLSSVEKITCYSIIYGFISLVALVGNALVCFVIIKNPGMRSVTNLFLLNLALADILFILVTVPPVMNLVIMGTYWVFGEMLCLTIPFLNTVTLSTSIYTMVLLAIDRYYAVVHPFRAKLRHTVRRTFALITLIWILSALVAAPQIPSRLFIRIPNKLEIYCAQDWSKLGGKLGQQIYSVAIFVIFFAVPIIIISYAYTAIILRLRKTDAPLGETFQASQGRTRDGKKTMEQVDERAVTISRNKRKTTFMMLTVIIAFLVCMLPFHIFSLASHFLSEERLSRNAEVISVVQSILTVFAVCSSACNPIIYNFFSLKFRRAFGDVFRCKYTGQTVLRNTDMTSEFDRHKLMMSLH